MTALDSGCRKDSCLRAGRGNVLQYQDHCRSTHSTGRTIIACMMNAARTKKSRRSLTVVRRYSSFRAFISVEWLLLRYETATSRPVDAHDDAAAAVVPRTRLVPWNVSDGSAGGVMPLARAFSCLAAECETCRITALSTRITGSAVSPCTLPIHTIWRSTQGTILSLFQFASHASPVSTRPC
jgi:hypothetical protein